MKMEIIITDSTGKVVGKVKDDTLYNIRCEKVCKVDPKTTFSKFIKILLRHELADLLMRAVILPNKTKDVEMRLCKKAKLPLPPKKFVTFSINKIHRLYYRAVEIANSHDNYAVLQRCVIHPNERRRQ